MTSAGAVLDRPAKRDPFAGEAWWDWVASVAPRYFPVPFAPHHVEMWEWAWALEDGEAPGQHLTAILARGGAKSTNAEAITAAVGLTGRRRYALYVCDTQPRADDHVGNVGAILESPEAEEFYRQEVGRKVGKYGDSKGWRRNRLHTAGGFIVDALGLDVAARGVKVEDQRPDFIVFDDIDALHDTPTATRKKLDTITKSVLPAGSNAMAVLAVQNLVLPDGIFAQLSDGRATFLARRRVIGPIPALRNMTVAYDAEGLPQVDGEPTWVGQDVAECQRQVEDFGLAAFVEEAQHDVEDADAAKWCREQIDYGRLEDHPELDLCGVVVDPSGGAGKGHDEQGLVAVGRGVDGKGYVLEDWSCSLSAGGWGRRTVLLAIEVGADWIRVEDNYGGDSMTNTVITAAQQLVREGVAAAAEYATDATVSGLSAQGSKGERATPVAALYGEKERPESWAAARVHHVGHFPELEREMRTWDPTVSKSPNRLDAMVHGVRELGILPAKGKSRRRGAPKPMGVAA